MSIKAEDIKETEAKEEVVEVVDDVCEEEKLESSVK